MVIFGVTGDLARKKLLPAIYDLANRGLLPAGFTLVGYGRRDWSKADFEDYIKEAVKAGARTPFRDNVWERLAEGMVFVSGNFDDDAAFDQLAATLSELDQTLRSIFLIAQFCYFNLTPNLWLLFVFFSILLLMFLSH